MTLVCGSVSAPLINPFGRIHRIDALSAQAMYKVCLNAWPRHNSAILCAAVADFAPQTESNEKIKKALGIERMPVDARTGLKKTLDSFRA